MSGTVVRVLAVLELLQANKRITGAEIADRLGVDARSVRRYIKQIQEMGVPVESEQGRYGAYRLDTGYRLPPLMFREEEIIALTIGLMVVRAYQFPLDAASVTAALAKIQRTVPKQFFDQVRAIQDVMHFHPIFPASTVAHTVVDTVARGVWQHTSIQMTYASRKGDDTARLIDPYGVVVYEGHWYTVGYCHLRTDLRIFRLDRVTDARATKHAFTPRPDFDAMDYVVRSLSEPQGFKQVEVLFDTTLSEAKQAMPPGLGTFEETEDGILFQCRALRLDWIAALLLNTDFPVRILQPEDLKNELRRLVQRASDIIDT